MCVCDKIQLQNSSSQPFLFFISAPMRCHLISFPHVPKCIRRKCLDNNIRGLISFILGGGGNYHISRLTILIPKVNLKFKKKHVACMLIDNMFSVKLNIKFLLTL